MVLVNDNHCETLLVNDDHFLFSEDNDTIDLPREPIISTEPLVSLYMPFVTSSDANVLDMVPLLISNFD